MRDEDIALYDSAAADWWSGQTRWVRVLRNMVPARLRHFRRAVPDWQGLDVLDLGCAGGFMTEAIARHGARVTGIDPAREALAAARSHAAVEGLDIRYDEGSGETLPYADASFDAVVSVDVLEHVSNLDAVLTEVTRVLRPGGWFLFDTINQSWLARLVVIFAAERLLGILPRGTHDPGKFVSDSTLREKLSNLGFKVEPFEGLAPVGIDSRGDFTFGLIPMTQIVYIGSASKQP